MIEIKGNIWDQQCTVICITTNGATRNDGAAIMGRGVALQAKQRNPGLEFKFGTLINEVGNIFQVTEEMDNLRTLAIFPTKYHWKERSSRILIAESVLFLREFAIKIPHAIIILPRPGCGNGGLSWEGISSLNLFHPGVKDICSILPDNVKVITNEV